MAEFYTRDRDANRLSVGSYDFDVNDGLVDLSQLDDDERTRIEYELSRLSVVEREDDDSAERAAEEALQAERERREAEELAEAERLARAEEEAAARGHGGDAEQLDQGEDAQDGEEQ